MKRIYSMIAVLLLAISLISCQATPEDLVVKSKAGDELQKAIEATPDTTPEVANEEQQPTTIKVKLDKSNDAGTLEVHIDADVVIADTMPVATIKKHNFTQEEVDGIVKVLIGDATMYDLSAPETKADIEAAMVNVRRESTDLESDLAQSNGITNLEDLKAMADEWLGIYQKRYEDAPQSIAPMESFSITSGDCAIRAMVGEEKAELFFSSHPWGDRIKFMHFGGYNIERCFDGHKATAIEGDVERRLEMNYDDAVTLAKDTIQSMGIEGMVLAKTYLSEDALNIVVDGEDTLGLLNSGRQFYLCCFEREVMGGSVTTSNHHINGNDEDKDASYSEPLEYERLQLWIDDTGIRQMIWESPHDVVELVNETASVQIKGEDAAQAITDQIMLQYADMYNGVDHRVINIDRVELELARIRYKGHPGEYIVVPVWSAYGSILERIPQSAKKDYERRLQVSQPDAQGYFMDTVKDPETSLVTINALDGTVINRRYGY